VASDADTKPQRMLTLRPAGHARLSAH